jgi:hypothetical protein
VGSALRTFRLVRAAGAGCGHHLLLRAGRPSYPDADQGAEDAADAFADHVMAALTTWWARWVLPAQCRRAGHGPTPHELAVVADPVEVGDDSDVLHHDDGMRTLDVWLAHRRDGGAVIATDPRGLAAEDDDGPLGPAVPLRVLLLAEGSGDADLRDV